VLPDIRRVKSEVERIQEDEMPGNEDLSYLEARMNQERALASTCEDNTAALVHLRMAEEYERRLAQARSALRLEPADSAG
jgi:hypothetical protein